MLRKTGLGLSIRASGYYDESKDDDVPYNNDRLDDALSIDYSQTIGGSTRPRETSGVYASKITKASQKGNTDRSGTSGVYSTKIDNSPRRNATSTPKWRDSGIYTPRIGQTTQSYERNKDGENNHLPAGMDAFGKTIYRPVYDNQAKQEGRDTNYPSRIIEDNDESHDNPWSTQWPETARSYPVGFEASNIANSVSYNPPMQTNIRKNSSDSHKQNRRNKGTSQRLSSDNETPEWANRLLAKESSLLGKFREMKQAINKWTLRHISRKSRQPYTKYEGPTMLDLFATNVNTSQFTEESTSQLVKGDRSSKKTNNIAVCFLGLFLMIIFVFPIISIIVIFTDRSDFAEINLSMKFNGSVDENLNVQDMEYAICRETDLAFSSDSSFHSCGVTQFRNGSIIADVTLLFLLSHYPYGNEVIERIDKHFKNATILNTYSYEANSTQMRNFGFAKKRLINNFSYSRYETTTTTTTDITILQTTQIPETTKAQTTISETYTKTSHFQTTEVLTSETTKQSTQIQTSDLPTPQTSSKSASTETPTSTRSVEATRSQTTHTETSPVKTTSVETSGSQTTTHTETTPVKTTSVETSGSQTTTHTETSPVKTTSVETSGSQTTTHTETPPVKTTSVETSGSQTTTHTETTPVITTSVETSRSQTTTHTETSTVNTTSVR